MRSSRPSRTRSSPASGVVNAITRVDRPASVSASRRCCRSSVAARSSRSSAPSTVAERCGTMSRARMRSRGGCELASGPAMESSDVHVPRVLRRDDDRVPRLDERVAGRHLAQRGLELLLRRGREPAVRVDQPERRAGHERRHERHDHEHREERRRDEAEVEPDVEHDQLGQAARVHEGADRRRVAPAEAAVAGRRHRAEPLADDRDDDQPERDQPQLDAVDRADLRPEAGDDEEERQEDERDEVVDPRA